MMATQNLFEKYGIKDVADVTFYRIEKKEETYEAQRTISVASVLKGAVELRTVYPFEDGVSIDEGFEAYVFTDADIIRGTNYDCDDENSESKKVTVVKKATGGFKVKAVADTDPDTYKAPEKENAEDIPVSGINAAALVDGFDVNGTAITDDDIVYTYTVNGEKASDALIEQAEFTNGSISYDIAQDGTEAITADTTFTVTYTIEATSAEIETNDTVTGVVSGRGTSAGDINYRPNPGTHEYSYAEQAFMLFAKRQNLITKTGTRFSFGTEEEIKDIMEGLTFDDNYAIAPNSSERVVVLGPSVGTEALDKETFWSDANYDTAEVTELISKLAESFTAKAYDIVYNTYAELVVEDEMGYYTPKFLGSKYDKKNHKIIFANEVKDEGEDTINIKKSYIASVKGNESDGSTYDRAIANAIMWGEGEHYSINDAIDALREKLRAIDADSSAETGINGVYGGYLVTDKGIPAIGGIDTDSDSRYFYTNNGSEVQSGVRSTYSLAAVLNALADLNAAGITGEVEVDYGADSTATIDNETTTIPAEEVARRSNRAIYVDVVDASTAASSYIYLLHNKNYKNLAGDNEGIFTFYDKKGNKLYYQDRIFAGVEYLALVIIGTAGMIFVVNRHGEKDTSRVAWMVSNSGFVSDKAAKKLAANGLIHTVDITANDETFEATCSVKSLAVRKTIKKVNHYTPVLFLDTLKVSTIEQTAEETYATGGHGNANLIGWDYGKAITLSLEDALFTPASFSASLGAYEGNDFRKGVKETKQIDRTEKVIAKRSFIVPEGNQNGTPSEADKTAQAVFIDPNTMEPYPDGTPIAEGEIFLKWTRSIAYEGQSLGHTIEISADKFPGTYKIVGDTYIKNKGTDKEERFQFIIPQAKMNSERTITLEADGDPVVFDMDLTVLRPDDGIMVRFVQYDVVENEEENDGSTMVVGTENLNLLDDAELYKVGGASDDSDSYIGATEY